VKASQHNEYTAQTQARSNDTKWITLTQNHFGADFYHIITYHVYIPTNARKMYNYKLSINCIMTNVLHTLLIYLSIYLCHTCFGLSFSPSSVAGVQLWQRLKSPGYGVSTRARMARVLTPYPGDLNRCRSCTPVSEDGLKGSPKHVMQNR
jgi:hypothetical protein